MTTFPELRSRAFARALAEAPEQRHADKQHTHWLYHAWWAVVSFALALTCGLQAWAVCSD